MTVYEPVRVSRSFRQHLKAPPSEVFPLLCPVREREWVEDWHPSIVHSFSGFAERDCVFVTGDGDEEATWVVTEFDPSSHRIEFIKVTPGVTVGRITILLHERDDETLADVTYMYTALGERGRHVVDEFTESAYRAFMQTWEDALNRYLLTGDPVG